MTYECCYCGEENETKDKARDHDCDEKPTIIVKPFIGGGQ